MLGGRNDGGRRVHRNADLSQGAAALSGNEVGSNACGSRGGDGGHPSNAESVQQTRRAQEEGEAADHVAPRQQDGRGSTRESFGDQRRDSETRNPSQGSACASVASRVGRDVTVWFVQSSGQRVGDTENQGGGLCSSVVKVKGTVSLRAGLAFEGGRHVQWRSCGHVVGEGEMHVQLESSGQLLVDEGTEQVSDRAGVRRRERGDGEADHVRNDSMRVALMKAAALQTPELDVADIGGEVRMAARTLMAARSLGWIRSRAVELGLSVKSNLVTLARRKVLAERA